MSDHPHRRDLDRRDPHHAAPERRGLDRRDVVTSALAASIGFATLTRAAAQGELKPTPSCGDEATVQQTKGPFYKPRSPERFDLREPGIKGQPIALTGFVLTRTCRPLVGALVDLWHADNEGAYDNAGFRLRGHQFTDAEGRYRFLTVVPAAYEGRTRHYHVKLQAPVAPGGREGRLLTTQLYFPGEPKNRSDGLFRRELVMKVEKADGSLAGRFDFVLDMR